MNTYAAAALLLSVCAMTAAQESLQLTVKASAESVPTADPVTLEINLANAGDADVSIDACHWTSMYQLTVTGPDGKDVPMNDEGKRLAAAAECGYLAGVDLKPGQKRTTLVEQVNKYYNMSALGKYTIVVKMPWQNLDGTPGDIVSNEVSVTIAAPK